MTSDRWQRIEEIYHSAREREGSQRAAFLKEACAGDDALRREVESLLAEEKGAEFLEAPALEAAAKLLVKDRGQSWVGRQLGSYQVISFLDAGGMGEVYRGRDTRLDRPVAIKILPAHLAERPELRERFEREARAIASLNHPHICVLHDIGHQDGIDYLVMEYLEGETLARRLFKGPLTLEQVFQYAIEIADALDNAHRKGITHRDLKPGNIMLTGSGAKLLDFGLAKLRQDAAGSVSGLTTTQDVLSGQGAILGTLQYMAPEQVEGKTAQVDARTDIFAFGAVLYEMATGKKAFEGKSQASVIAKILETDPPPVSSLRPTVPPALDHLVRRCLAKDPEKRWQSARDVCEQLRWISDSRGARQRSWGLWAAAVIVVALLALVVWRATRPRIPAQPRLAVLAFTSLDNTPESQIVGKGIRETLNARVAQLAPSLDVVPTTVVTRNADGGWGEAPVDSAAAARESGANLTLRGTVYITGNRVIVHYVLTNIEVEKELSGDVVDGDRGDLYSLEDRVARSVINGLGVAVSSQLLRAVQARAPAVESAFEPYVKGRGYLENYDRPENVESAIDAFKDALALDSKFAVAYAGLGKAYWRKYENTRDTQWLESARQACGQAATLDAKLGEAHICLGRLENVTGQYDEAVQEFQRALDQQPASDDAYVGLAAAYEGLNKSADAEKTYRRAINLRPEYWAGYNWLGAFYYAQGRYADAAEAFTQMVARAPDSFWGYSNLGLAQLYEGRYTEAVSSFQRSVSIRPSSVAYSNLATAYFYQRQYAEAVSTYRKALNLAERDYMLWGNLGDALSWTPGFRSRAPEAYRKAISLADEQLQVNPHDAQVLGYRAWYHGALGNKPAALSDAQRALQLAPTNAELMLNVALVYNQFGETQQALAWLTKAVRGGFPTPILRDTPNFDSLRANPSFQHLVKDH
jgi:tetratricopeptide (TPR) repeat protein/TolB-like protein